MPIFRTLVVVVLLGGGVAWWLSQPNRIDPSVVNSLQGDTEHGREVFLAAGCASCHMAPGAKAEAQLILSGGQSFPSDFGTFKAPNISQDPEAGIGDWSVEDLANALLEGVSPEGRHYYPAFPYASYTKMQPQDIVDLYSYLKTLPADASTNHPHELQFPFNQDRLIGFWKLLYLNKDWVIDAPDMTPQQQHGRYLVEAMSHCGECHTPRNVLGAMDTKNWLAGATAPDGKPLAPNLQAPKLTWSAAEISSYLRNGFTPDYDSVGGHMSHVVDNYAELPTSYAQDVADYLKVMHKYNN